MQMFLAKVNGLREVQSRKGIISQWGMIYGLRFAGGGEIVNKIGILCRRKEYRCCPSFGEETTDSGGRT